MLNVPESIKRLYQTDGINKNFRVHFPNGENADLTNKDIVEGSVKFAESVSSKDVLKFGLSEQSKIEFECVGVQNIFGMTIECSNEIDTSSLTAEDIQTIQEGEWDGTLVLSSDSDIDYGYFRIPLGTFVVSSCPRSHGAMAHRRVVGYSNLFGEEYEQYRTLFDGAYPYQKLHVDLYLFEYLLGLVPMDATENTFTIDSGSNRVLDTDGSMYDSNGNEINVSASVKEQRIRAITNYGEFIKIQSTGEYDAYRRNGEKVMQAIIDSGYDCRYDDTGKKIFPTIEAAVRARMPYLFSPVINNLTWYTKKGSAEYSGKADTSVPLHDGLNPFYANLIQYEEGGAQEQSRFFYGGVPGISNTISGRTPHYFASLTSLVFLSNEIRIYSSNGTGETVTLDFEPCDFEITSATSLRVPVSVTPTCLFTLNASLKTTGYYFNVTNDSTGNYVASTTYKKGVYQNAISIPELIEGFLELSAEFGRISRKGGEIKKLSKQNPVNIEPSDVEELWWDEYDVEQIGTVRYNIADTQAIVEYQIGNGGSVYDFGDNYVIKRIFATYTEDNYTDAINLINSLIDRYFVPNVTDVPFVPVDMTMRGLPYVESGDYIVYDDGTDQVGTYVLSREMDGVQSLFDEVESNGGEVLGN